MKNPHRAYAFDRAYGFLTPEQLSRKYGDDLIAEWDADPKVAALIETFRQHLEDKVGEAVRLEIGEELKDLAIDTLKEIMGDSTLSPSTRAGVATKIIDGLGAKRAAAADDGPKGPGLLIQTNLSIATPSDGAYVVEVIEHEPEQVTHAPVFEAPKPKKQKRLTKAQVAKQLEDLL